MWALYKSKSESNQEFKDSSVSEFLSVLWGAYTEYLRLLVTYLGFIWENTAQLEAFSIILTKVCSNVKSTYKTRKNVYVANYITYVQHNQKFKS